MLNIYGSVAADAWSLKKGTATSVLAVLVSHFHTIPSNPSTLCDLLNSFCDMRQLQMVLLFHCVLFLAADQALSALGSTSFVVTGP